MVKSINSGGADSARGNARQAGRELGESMNNTKFGKGFNKSGEAIVKGVVDTGKAINKAAQETVYGNIKKPEAITGGALAAATAKKSLSSAARGGGVGLLGEFGLRSVKNIGTDVFGFGK